MHSVFNEAALRPDAASSGKEELGPSTTNGSVFAIGVRDFRETEAGMM